MIGESKEKKLWTITIICLIVLGGIVFFFVFIQGEIIYTVGNSRYAGMREIGETVIYVEQKEAGLPEQLGEPYDFINEYNQSFEHGVNYFRTENHYIFVDFGKNNKLGGEGPRNKEIVLIIDRESLDYTILYDQELNVTWYDGQ